jgi:exopolysaccharide biosynthesis protein
LYNALSTRMKAVQDGKVAIRNEDSKLNPQTGIGVMNDGRLLLFVVDGRNPSHSLGMTRREVGETLAAFGAREALCMDGGGSTTLVLADPKPRVVNIPVGLFDLPGSERAVGNSLAISLEQKGQP